MDLTELFRLLEPEREAVTMTTNRQGISTTVIHLDYIQPRACVTQLEVLTEMRKLLTYHWCQHAIAVDVNDRSIYHNHRDAYRWCLSGAAMKVMHDMPRNLGWLLDVEVVAVILGFDGTMEMEFFNDSSTHDEVLALLDKHIACLDHAVRAGI